MKSVYIKMKCYKIAYLKKKGGKMKNFWMSIVLVATGMVTSVEAEVKANPQAQILQMQMKQQLVQKRSLESSGFGCSISPIVYKYKHTESEVGDIITVGGKKYIIVKIPFLEFGSRGHYYVKMPVEYDASSNYNVWLNTEFVGKSTKCFRYRFAGYPSLNNRIWYSDGISFNTYNNKLYASNSISFYTGIKVGRTVVTISMYLWIDKQVAAPSAPDFTDGAPWNFMKKKNTFIANLKKLLNYIEIGKVQ